LLIFFGLFLFGEAVSLNILLALVAVSFVFSLIRIEIVIVMVILSVLFSPEITLFGLGASSKAFTVRFEDITVLVALLGLLGNRALHSKPLFVRTRLTTPILVFLGIYVTAAIRGIVIGARPFLATSLLTMKMIEYFLFFFILSGYLEERRQAKLILGIFCVITIAILGFYLPQVAGVDIETQHRITSPFESIPEPTTVGGILLIIMSFCGAYLFHARRAAVKTALAVVFGVTFVIFLFTLSRTSYMGVILALVVFAIYTRKRWMLLLMPAAVLLAPIILPAKVMVRIASTWTTPAAGAVFDFSTMERIRVWKKALWVLQHSPLIGYGAGSWDIIDSNYVRIIVESGLAGMVAFAWIFVILYRAATRLYREGDAFTKPYVLGFLMTMTALLAHGFAAITFYIVRITEFFWIMAAILMFMDREQGAGQSVVSGPQDSGGKSS